MNDRSLDELDGLLRQAVEAWRAEPEPAAALDAALQRLRRPPRRGPRSAWRLAPALVAACLAGVFLFWVPSAFAALAETMRPPLAAAPPAIDAQLRAAWRPVLVVHIASLMLGYLFFLAGWAAAQLDVFLRVFSLRWLSRVGPRASPVGAAAGAALWLAGVILGAWWASAVLGRAWGWDPREVGGLVTVAAGAAWWLLGRRLRDDEGVWPAAVAAVGVAVVVYSYWYSTIGASGHSYEFRRSGVAIDVCVAANLLLLATAWLAERLQGRPAA
jgi:hypothetical protein